MAGLASAAEPVAAEPVAPAIDPSKACPWCGRVIMQPGPRSKHIKACEFKSEKQRRQSDKIAMYVLKKKKQKLGELPDTGGEAPMALAVMVEPLLEPPRT